MDITRKRLLWRKSWFSRSTGSKFTLDQFLQKIGIHPKCYLTGRPIDLDKGDYHFDHIKPKSKGGDDSLENCGLASRSANLAKNDMTPNEFIAFCQEVLTYNGYLVIKIKT